MAFITQEMNHIRTNLLVENWINNDNQEKNYLWLWLSTDHMCTNVWNYFACVWNFSFKWHVSSYFSLSCTIYIPKDRTYWKKNIQHLLTLCPQFGFFTFFVFTLLFYIILMREYLCFSIVLLCDTWRNKLIVFCYDGFNVHGCPQNVFAWNIFIFVL